MSDIRPQLCDTNLLSDGDMEAVGTAAYIASASATLSKESSDLSGSTQCLRATHTGTANPGFTSIDFVAAKTYRLTGWVRISQAGGPQPAIFDALYGELWRGQAIANSWQFFDVTFTNQRDSGPIFFSDVNVAGQYSEWDLLWLCEVVSDSSTVEKKFIYRVYDSNGGFKKTWNDVISEPTFDTYINSGPGQLRVDLARTFNDFGEGDDVNFDNRVDVLVHDKDVTTVSGMLLFSGYISAYNPKTDGSDETVEVTILPYSTRAGFDLLTTSGGATTQVDYYSYDPSLIAKNIIDNFNSTAGGVVTYTINSINQTNTSVSYNFNAVTYREALDKVLELTPEEWYFAISPASIYSLKKKNASADHTLTIGKEISSIDVFKNSEQIINVVLFTGGEKPDGTTLYEEYTNTGSIDRFGRRVIKMNDSRVTLSATAQTMAEKIINQQGIPDVRVTISVIDNNKDTTFGYDIESFSVGQTVSIKDPHQNIVESFWDVSNWDEDYWDYAQEYILAEPLQIQSINYTPDSITLELSSRLPQVAKRIEDIKRNVENLTNKNVQGAPA